MARTGGRNTVFAWFVGIVMICVVGALVWFAVPAFPSVAVWLGDQYRNATGTNDPGADDAEAGQSAEPSDIADQPASVPGDCAALYPETLWALLNSTAGAALVQETAVPEDAAALAADLGAGDVLVCRWVIPTGQAITTLVATVGEDAPDIAATFLGSRQYACTASGIRTVCSRDADGRIESHELRGGLWTMSVQDGWRPPGYSEDVAGRIWPE